MKEQAMYQIGTPLPWIVEYKSVWRTAVLLVFLFCLLSPWATDRIHVPAPNNCSWRVDDDFAPRHCPAFGRFLLGITSL